MSSRNFKKTGDIVHSLDRRAPHGTAEDWDPVGLLLGDPNQETPGVVLSNDLTFEAVELALQRKYSLIVTHHPCIFPKNRGLSKIIAGTPIYEALRNGIAVAAYHTNFDQCALEVVEQVSKGLGVVPQGRLFEKTSETTPQGIVKGFGYGFWGEFPSSRPFSDLAKDVKSLFNIHGFWITNPVPSTVTRVGFVAGKGASFVDAAAALKCDLFITGEAGYHTALSGSRKGVAVMEIGHRESERFFIETMKNWLSDLGLECAEVQTPTQMIWQEV
jgi:dinuclear metal center YbgI/SA1388 family protein